MWNGQDPYQRILMGPGGNNPMSGYDVMLVPRGHGDVVRAAAQYGSSGGYLSSGGYPSVGMDPRGVRALGGPSEMSNAPALNMAVQNFSGTCVLPKPAKKALKKKAICAPAHSDFNWPLVS